MIHRTLYRIFFVFIFVVFAISVGLFLRGKIILPDATNTTSGKVLGVTDTVNNTLNNAVGGAATTVKTATQTAAQSSAVAVDGSCGYPNGARISDTTSPTATCLLGKSSNFAATDSGWKWTCSGENGGKDASCSATKVVTTTLANAATITTPTSDNVTTASTDTAAVSTKTTPTSSNTTTSSADTAAASTTTVPTTSTTNTTTTQKTDTTQNTTATNNTATTSTATSATNVSSATQETATTNNGEKSQLQNDSTNIPEVEINQSVVVLAQNISADNNPKISGQVDKALEISTINFSEEKGTGKKIKLSGKAQPNVLLTIYIFSNDPIVITVKTDENGNWSYELDKELANGKHEAYVAVTENSGKILTKSEPIAFVKTAEAVSIIPVSDLQSSQSPMVRSQQQYVLMAILIIVICLVISLILIGIVTYKRNLNEKID